MIGRLQTYRAAWLGLFIFSCLLFASCEQLTQDFSLLLSAQDAQALNTNDAVTFRVQLSDTSDFVITVDFKTAGQSARPGVDYADTSGTIAFEPGQVEEYIDVRLLGTSFKVLQKQFSLQLENPTWAELERPRMSVTGTIFNHERADSLVALNISDAKAALGDTVMSFPLRLSGASEDSIKVGFATSGQSAQAGVDYADTTGALVFGPGQTERTINVRLLGAPFNAPQKQFHLQIENLEGAVLPNQLQRATGTIQNK